MLDGSIYRLLDASHNRASEGLRTIEDYARFILDHHDLTESTKTLRHSLTTALASLDRNQLILNRDTINDCGTTIKTETENARPDARSVVLAAFGRVQQALRSLEEYGKVVSSSFAPKVEALRYQAYTLEKKFNVYLNKSAVLQSARLYLLVDLQGETGVWLNRLRQLALAGADLIQIRDKRADDRTLWSRCKLAADLFRELDSCDSADSTRPRCQLIINDRADIAAAVDADGVHVGQEELPVEVVRRILGDGKLIGLSTHSIEQVRQAVDCGADYIGCGPTFPSRTKSFDQYVGVALAAAATKDFPLPAFAIGGINESNLAELLAVGVSRVAVSGAVWGRENEAEHCKQLAQQLHRFGSAPKTPE